MNYFFLTILAFLPSIIWLLFYLREDAHPESNQMILKIFFYGMLAAVPAALIELGVFKVFNKLSPLISKWVGTNLSSILITILTIFIGVALIEETIKYLVIKEKVLNNPEFDEPLDAMLYMIIAALGFAALENVLILFPLGPAFLIGEALALISLRFVGATFLHALCSGLVGYFLGLSFFETKKRGKLILIGLGIAIVLHGLYNFSIIVMKEEVRLIIPIIILIGLAIVISFGFKKLKKWGATVKLSKLS